MRVEVLEVEVYAIRIRGNSSRNGVHIESEKNPRAEYPAVDHIRIEKFRYPTGCIRQFFTNSTRTSPDQIPSTQHRSTIVSSVVTNKYIASAENGEKGAASGWHLEKR